ncbi:MAG TPA: YncE family protein [Candidatus Binatia bacterium]|nr:YncE family protein [Candidatus Binatia bacterium]
MRWGLWVAVLLGGTATTVPGAPFAWLAHDSAGKVGRMDLATHTTHTVAVAGGPFTTAASLTGLRAYSANADQSISVFDASATLPALLTTIPVPAFPVAVAARADGAKVYAPLGDGTVAVVDAATNTLLSPISIAAAASFGAIVTSLDGTRAYIAKMEYPVASVAVLDTVADAFVADVYLNSAGTFPIGIAVSPDGTRAYATVFGVPEVYVIDAETNLLTDDVSIALATDFGTPQPWGLAVSPDGARVYVAERDVDRLAVLDPVAMTELTSVPVGSTPTVVDLTPDGARAYVVNTGDGSLSIFDTATNGIVGTVLTVADGPSGGARFIAPGTTTTTLAPTTSTTSTTATTTTSTSSTTSTTVPPPPALSPTARACQKTIGLSFKRFGAKAHGLFVACFQRLLDDVAGGEGTAGAAGACLAALDPNVPSAKIARLRTVATAQIVARCGGVTPAELAQPCSPGASTIADVASCVLDAQAARVSEATAAEHGAACGVATAAGLSSLYPGLCAP